MTGKQCVCMARVYYCPIEPRLRHACIGKKGTFLFQVRDKARPRLSMHVRAKHSTTVSPFGMARFCLSTRSSIIQQGNSGVEITIPPGRASSMFLALLESESYCIKLKPMFVRVLNN